MNTELSRTASIPDLAVETSLSPLERILRPALAIPPNACEPTVTGLLVKLAISLYAPAIPL